MKYVIIGSGGMGMFSFMGRMKMLQDNGKFDDLKEISGASAGALMALLYTVSKGNIQDIFDNCMTIRGFDDKINLLELFDKYGLIDTLEFFEKVMKFCENYCSRREPTFQELYNHNPIKIHIAAFCVDNTRTDYFSVDTHPNMSIVKAVKASMAIPLVFNSCIIDERIYIDGAVQEDIPGLPFIDKKPSDIYAMSIKLDGNKNQKVTDLKSYISKIYKLLLTNRIQYDIPQVSINTLGKDTLDFNMNDKTKMELFVSGYLPNTAIP